MGARQLVGHVGDQLRVVEVAHGQVDGHAHVVAGRPPAGGRLEALAHHPPGDGLDRTGELGQLDELVRRNLPQARVVPADQRLGPDREAGAQVDARLEVQHELVERDGVGQVADEGQPFHAGAVLLGGVDRRPGARPLGHVHGHVGPLDERGHVVGVLGEQGDADGGVGLQADVAHEERLDERVADAGRHLAGIVLGDLAGEHQGELVAAEPGHQSVVELLGEAVADAPQQLVADVVAEGVVDLLELVEVHHQQRHLLAGGRRLPHRAVQLLVEQAPVGQAGEPVVEGLAPQRLGGGDGVGDVLEGDGHGPVREGEGPQGHDPLLGVGRLDDQVVDAERHRPLDHAGEPVPKPGADQCREGLLDGAADLGVQVPAHQPLRRRVGGPQPQHLTAVLAVLLQAQHDKRLVDAVDDVRVLVDPVLDLHPVGDVDAHALEGERHPGTVDRHGHPVVQVDPAPVGGAEPVADLVVDAQGHRPGHRLGGGGQVSRVDVGLPEPGGQPLLLGPAQHGGGPLVHEREAVLARAADPQDGVEVVDHQVEALAHAVLDGGQLAHRGGDHQGGDGEPRDQQGGIGKGVDGVDGQEPDDADGSDQEGRSLTRHRGGEGHHGEHHQGGGDGDVRRDGGEDQHREHVGVVHPRGCGTGALGLEVGDGVGGPAHAEDEQRHVPGERAEQQRPHGEGADGDVALEERRAEEAAFAEVHERSPELAVLLPQSGSKRGSSTHREHHLTWRGRSAHRLGGPNPPRCYGPGGPEGPISSRSPVTSTDRPGRGSTYRPVALVLGSMLSLQFGAAIATHLFDEVGSAGASALRLGLAAVLLVAWARPPVRSWSPDHRRSVVLLGLAMAVMNFAFYEAVSRLPLGAAITIEFLGPLGLAGVAALGFGQQGSDAGALDPIGVAAALVAALFWAAYILAGSRLAATDAGLASLAGACTVAAVLVVPIGVAANGTDLLDGRVLLLGLGMAVLASVIPYSFELRALERMAKRTFSILVALEPAIGALVGAVLLDQHLGALSLTGIALVVAAGIGATATASPGQPPLLPDSA